MKPLCAWLCVSALLLVLAPAQAEPPPGRGEGRGEGRSRAEGTPGTERVRPDEARRDGDERRPPKLSPEERRELRQQIHEAGHDLYRRPKRQGP